MWSKEEGNMILRCENPSCMLEAHMAAKFLDPRRGHGEDLAYTKRYFCSNSCEEAIVGELERQATYARLVH